MITHDKSAMEIAEHITEQKKKFPGTEVPVEPRHVGLMADALIEMRSVLRETNTVVALRCLEKWEKKPTV